MNNRKPTIEDIHKMFEMKNKLVKESFEELKKTTEYQKQLESLR